MRARRDVHQGPLAAIVLFMLCILALPKPGAAQNTSPAEGTSMRFALTAASDGTLITEQTFRAKWLAVYFGYTSCPDVCPRPCLI